jgi:hypothetical protein
MKKIFLVLAVVGTTILSSCTGPEGPRGATGYSAESEVFELRNINFGYDATNGYNIYQPLNPQILDSDVLLIYRLSGTIDPQTPIWQSIPRTLYLSQGELDYDFDFSKEDFTIYAGGTYNLATTPTYLNNQTFRIVIIPGYFSNKKAQKVVDLSDYNAVIKAYNIDESKMKKLN